MSDLHPATIDFETKKIEGRPAYPPEPVSLAIKYAGQPAIFYAWGHPTGNNCTRDEAAAALATAWEHPGGVLCQNTKFDMDVAETFFGLPRLPWQRLHDTMFLLFLTNPHATTFSLKPSAEALLGQAPTERDDVEDWLIANQPVPGVTITRGPKSKNPAGGYISEAPADIVGPYCIGDVDRTEALFNLLHPTLDEGMLVAYARERRLLGAILDMERRGVRVDVPRLESDLVVYTEVFQRTSKWCCDRLGAPGMNLDSSDELLAALKSKNAVDENLLLFTEAGKKFGHKNFGARSTSKESLMGAVTDRDLLEVLVYRNQLSTCLTTFINPWLATARIAGRVYPQFHQVKGTDNGARTGRFSSSRPNFQNVPKDLGKGGIPQQLTGLPHLPLMRSYIIPDEGCVLIDRDYDQQEMRVLAHYEDGAMQRAYIDDPSLDYHTTAMHLINREGGTNFTRDPVKSLAFGLNYGMGKDLLATKMQVDVSTAVRVKTLYLAALPGVKKLMDSLKARARMGRPIRTWGGRVYYCEPPKVKEGADGITTRKTFDYKLLNILVQGGSADCTKEAMARYAEAGHSWPMLLQVHDELMTQAPIAELVPAMAALRAAMEGVEFDVKMTSSGKFTDKNWSVMQEYLDPPTKQ